MKMIAKLMSMYLWNVLFLVDRARDAKKDKNMLSLDKIRVCLTKVLMNNSIRKKRSHSILGITLTNLDLVS